PFRAGGNGFIGSIFSGNFIQLSAYFCSYATNALAINEFEGQQLFCEFEELIPPEENVLVCPITRGESLVEQRGYYSATEMKWVMFLALLGLYLFFLGLMFLALQFVRFKPKPVVISPIPVEELKKDKTRGNAAFEVGRKRAKLEFMNLSYSVKVKGKQVQLLND